MYRAGVSRAKIVELCHAERATVYWHLRKRAAEDPTLEAEHIANLKQGPPRPKPPTAEWTARRAAFFAFITRYGRPPATHGKAEGEDSLAGWLVAQRRALADGLLTPEKISALDAAGPWRWTAEKIRDEERWHERLAELAVFVQKEGRWPRWRGAQSEHERVIGVWLHTQRQNNHRGRLGQEQRSRLDATTPKWADNHRTSS